MLDKILFKNFLLLILLVAISSCSGSGDKSSVSESTTNNQPNTTAISKPAVNVNAVNQTEKIKIKTAGGADFLSLKPKADGAKLVDANNQEIIRIKLDPGKIRFKDASDKVLGYVVTNQGSWQLETANKQTLYTLKKQNNGNYQLEDAAKKLVYQINSQGNGWEIQTPNNQLVYQVKEKQGKISLLKAGNNSVFYTKSGMSSIAFACLGFDVLTREQQAALVYAVSLTGGK